MPRQSRNGHRQAQVMVHSLICTLVATIASGLFERMNCDKSLTMPTARIELAGQSTQEGKDSEVAMAQREVRR